MPEPKHAVDALYAVLIARVRSCPRLYERSPHPVQAVVCWATGGRHGADAARAAYRVAISRASLDVADRRAPHGRPGATPTRRLGHRVGILAEGLDAFLKALPSGAASGRARVTRMTTPGPAMGPLSERDARITLSVAQHRCAAEVGRPGGAGGAVVDESVLTPRSARPQSGPRPASSSTRSPPSGSSSTRTRRRPRDATLTLLLSRLGAGHWPRIGPTRAERHHGGDPRSARHPERARVHAARVLGFDLPGSVRAVVSLIARHRGFMDWMRIKIFPTLLDRAGHKIKYLGPEHVAAPLLRRPEPSARVEPGGAALAGRGVQADVAIGSWAALRRLRRHRGLARRRQPVAAARLRRDSLARRWWS